MSEQPSPDSDDEQQAPKPDRESPTRDHKEPDRKQSGKNSADGGNCGVWMIIGCLGVTLTVALFAFFGGIIYLVANSDNAPAESTPTPISADTPADTDDTDATGEADDSETEVADDPAESDTDQDVVSFGEGTHTVGEDISPGIYYADEAGDFCYFERVSGFSGEFEDVIANQIVDGRAIVEILESDAGFTSERCGEWRSQPGQIRDDPSAPFENGIYLVGGEIHPGTWRAEGGGENCYWARLTGFTSVLDNVVTNEFGNPEPVVEISESDTGFESESCGTWHRSDDS